VLVLNGEKSRAAAPVGVIASASRRSIWGRLGRWVALATVGILVVGLAVGFVTNASVAPAAAATASDFNPGNIISDATFYNSSSMSSAQIQAFIDAKVSSCSTTCLENYRMTTPTVAANSRCGPYNGVQSQLASDIIYNVAVACGINPQVLIVLLQKEQGLVTSTGPSVGAYTWATGYGCSDTSACVATYSGFFNQVYDAAHQFRTYQATPTSWSYRAGRYNSILFSPTASCGTSSVYIQNQATAALYIYTPYQPDAAALANLYGTGDGCSSYGNRNFWRYFSDWFGSPTAGGWFAKTATSPDIYLLTATTKSVVPSGDILNALYAMGPYRVVPQDYLDGFAAAPPASAMIDDPLTGNLYLVGGGVKYHFVSCDQVAQYGFSCGSLVQLTSSQLNDFPTGSDVSSFFKTSDSPVVYWIDAAGTKHALVSLADVSRLAAGGSTTIVTLDDYFVNSLPTGPAILDPGSVVQQAGSPTEYMVDGTSTLIPLTSTQTLADLGLASGASTLSAADLAGFTTASAPLSSFVSCSGVDYAASRGTLYPITVSAAAGLSITTLDPRTCAILKLGTSAIAGNLFIKTASSASVYYVANDVKHNIVASFSLTALNGGFPVTFLTLSDAAVAAIPSGADILGPTSLVKTATSPVIYMVDGFSKLIPIATFATAADLGISQSYSIITQGTFAGYTVASGTLSSFVSCGSQSYAASGGKLWPTSAAAVTGLTVTPLDPATCSSLQMSSTAIQGSLFIKTASNATVYFVSGGTRRGLISGNGLVALNGGLPVTFLVMSDVAVNGITLGAPVLSSGIMVKTATSAAVYLTDGTSKLIPVPSFSVTSDLGISGYTTVPASAIASYTIASAPLTSAVLCGSTDSIGASGTNWTTTAANLTGLTLTTLDAATCTALARSANTITGPLFVKSASSASVYVIQNGVKQHVLSGAGVVGLADSNPIYFLTISDFVLAGIPAGPDVP
jgi:hypothetical protein